MNAALPDRLKSARNRAGLTQTGLAEATGLSQGYIAQIEQGDKTPSLDTLNLLAEALQVTPGWLLGQGIGEGVASYETGAMTTHRRELLADYDTPSGLRDLAADTALVASLAITAEEWQALASTRLPGPASKDGYVNLLFTIRAISGP
jgi:transcriptional regulator with XRE-family HTH domain